MPQPPSWRRAMRRAFIFGPIMFIAIWLLESSAKPMARITIAAFYTVAFIPLFYLMDRFAHRAYQRRLARDAERRAVVAMIVGARGLALRHRAVRGIRKRLSTITLTGRPGRGVRPPLAVS